MWKRMFIVLMCFFALTVFCGTIGAFGADVTGSLNIKYMYNKKAVPGAVFNLYKVAELSEGGKYIPTKEFAEYSVDFNMTKETEKSLAITLAGYVSRDKIKASDSGKTDSSGQMKFENLTKGLYLVIGEECKYGSYTYTTEPFLATIPDSDGNYDVTAEPKSAGIANPTPTNSPSRGRTSSGITSLRVMKIWKDSGNTDGRPASIVVQLLRNGSVYNEVTLNESNNWKYTWGDLSRSYTWTVVEKDVPPGYKVAVTKDDATYIVTNTYSDSKDTPTDNPNTPEREDLIGRPTDNPDTPEREDLIERPTDNPDTPEREDLMTPGPDGSSEDSDGGSGTTGSGTTGGGKLPQTGQLWWPVPFAAIIGMLLLLYAYGRFNKQGRSDE